MNSSRPLSRKIHDILVHIIETTTDVTQREISRDLLVTLPPLREWSEDSLRAMHELATFVEIRRNF